MLNVCWKERILLNMTSQILGNILLIICPMDLFLSFQFQQNTFHLFYIYIQLKPVEKSMFDYEEDILCLFVKNFNVQYCSQFLMQSQYKHTPHHNHQHFLAVAHQSHLSLPCLYSCSFQQVPLLFDLHYYTCNDSYKFTQFPFSPILLMVIQQLASRLKS